MNVNWFKNKDNVIYAEKGEFLKSFPKEIGITNLAEEIEKFAKNPTKEGLSLKGTKRTSIKLLIPNLTFGEEIEMGENVWIYLGENYECYCLYQPW